MPITLEFREPTSPRYIYVDPVTNKVHLMVSIVGGASIGTDNTCQSAAALKTFFGLNAGAAAAHNSARDELLRYQRALQYDLIILREESPLKTQKQERLRQIELYLEKLPLVAADDNLQTLRAVYPEFPNPIKDLLRQKTNCFAMRLRPTNMDPWLRTVDPVFSALREAPHLFFTALKAAYNRPLRAPIKSARESLMDAVAASQGAAAGINFPAIQEAIRTKAQLLFGKNVDVTQASDGTLMTKEYIDMVQGGASDDVSEYVDTLLSSCVPQFDSVVGVVRSPFNSAVDISSQADLTIEWPGRDEKLSILTQFFLAQVNFHCFSKNISAGDFGSIIEADATLRQQIPALVRTALEAGNPVEELLIEFINANQAKFGMSRTLADIDIASIKDKFRTQYETIKESPHFDEFIVLDDTKAGLFFTHQGSICVDFSDLINTNTFRARLDSPEFSAMRVNSQALPRVLSGTNDSVREKFVLQESDLKDYILGLIRENSGLDTAVELLLSNTETGVKLFDRLPEGSEIEILRAAAWPDLKRKVAAHISNPATLAAFNARFRGANTQIAITSAMARSLHVYAIGRFGIGVVPPVPTQQQMQELLRTAFSDVGVIDVDLSAGDGYVITLPPAKEAQLRQRIDTNMNRVYITPDMARHIYLEAQAQWGEHSPEIVHMKTLNNRGNPPALFIEALRLLDIQTQSITFPKGGQNGYLVQASADLLQRLANIEQTHAERESVALMAGMGGGGSRAMGMAMLFREARIAAPPIRIAARPADEAERRPAEGFAARIIDAPHGEIRRAPAGGAAAAGGGHDADAAQLTIQAVVAFGAPGQALVANANVTTLNCSERILREFKNIMRGTAILGRQYQNPYNGLMENVPANVDLLTARHLQILARNEHRNIDGIMRTDLYGGLLSDDKIAAIRCLVKGTTVSAKANVIAYGGYNSARQVLAAPMQAYIIDQSGLQWQGDLRNTGGMFFYPNAIVTPEYEGWQQSMYQTMYGLPRPAHPSANQLNVTWNHTNGILDLDGVAKGIEVEFRQALDAVVHQATVEPIVASNINFRFLKAGMGFFAEGLGLNAANKSRLELARLKGIEQALRAIEALPIAERQAALRGISRMDLPFSANPANDAITQTLERIRIVTVNLGIQWGGTPQTDALAPVPGFILATTNCGDPHAMVGNEGGHASVDASISTNSQVNHLNCAFNNLVQLRASPVFVPTGGAALGDIGLGAVAAPAVDAPHVGAERAAAGGERAAAGGERAVAGGEQAAAGAGLARFGLHGGRHAGVPDGAHAQSLIKQIIIQECKDRVRGNWGVIAYDPEIIEVGISRVSGNSSITSNSYALEKRGDDLVILDKTNHFAVIADPTRRTEIFNNFIRNIPRFRILEAQVQLLSQKLLQPALPPIERGQWTPMSSRCVVAGITTNRDTPQAMWEYGRGGSDGNYAFANANYKISIDSNGEVNVFNKVSGAVIDKLNEQALYVQALEALCQHFPELQQTLNAVSAAAAAQRAGRG